MQLLLLIRVLHRVRNERANAVSKGVANFTWSTIHEASVCWLIEPLCLGGRRQGFPGGPVGRNQHPHVHTYSCDILTISAARPVLRFNFRWTSQEPPQPWKKERIVLSALSGITGPEDVAR